MTSEGVASEPGVLVETKAYVCFHVFEQSRPVLYVTRPDGDWCFLCGEVHAENSDEYHVVGAGHIIDWDPSLREVLDLLPQQEAERAQVGAHWERCTF